MKETHCSICLTPVVVYDSVNLENTKIVCGRFCAVIENHLSIMYPEDPRDSRIRNKLGLNKPDDQK